MEPLLGSSVLLPLLGKRAEKGMGPGSVLGAESILLPAAFGTPGPPSLCPASPCPPTGHYLSQGEFPSSIALLGNGGCILKALELQWWLQSVRPCGGQQLSAVLAAGEGTGRAAGGGQQG